VTILALDTSSNFASVAIRADGRILSEITLESNEGFAHLIFPAIEKCRNEAAVDLQRIDCFAAASGPGSFTGIRVALSAIKGLAHAMSKPAIGISNLRALSSFGRRPRSLRAVVLDARRGEVYAAIYDRELECVSPEAVTPISNWLAHLDAGQDYEFIAISALNLNGTPFAGTSFTPGGKFLACAVALCAEHDGTQGKWLDPAAVDANYVRRSDAELFWRDAGLS
jgi:tRNA threonylcarbamoyladenosine biosynthesis protein TsaB